MRTRVENKIAVKNVTQFYKKKNKKHVVTTQTEHNCVLDSGCAFKAVGFTITYLPIQKKNIIHLQDIGKNFHMSLVSVLCDSFPVTS